MTIILTNDDGIDADGIRALQQAVSGESIIVAPNQQYSGCGHQVTTHKGIKLEKRSTTEYALDGTPADCTRMAITQIATNTKLVLSGINAGGNLGTDVYISGTVAAVREAAIHGIPGIAISHWIKKPLVIDWQVATNWTSRVLTDLLSRPLPPGSFWNVNLPHLEPEQPEPKIVLCQPSIDPLPVDFLMEGDNYYYQGKYSDRDRTPGTDVDVCFGGDIAVTLIRL
ncbi:5'/3'-nucleotidase SurE [Waterburya agarophytonicola K14]|uniref:5'-nucleotidase n=1 Tax=Waterburya agarophytonicola KI4 TaxID=2874699 RepID=A0A964BSI9_9CYAN|nr:5'/3'-nucleotidase SurE [Waterburya agarophytonicola]MCC0178359.1 5'/3'-nucleotidase SurE [Waterburya agarophytonicola KI4]